MSRFLLILSTCLSLPACQPSPDGKGIVGQLESDRIEITADFAEPITERLVVEGQAVDAGDLLVRQDDSRAQSRVREANAALAEVSARLDELVRGPRREQIEAAQAGVEGAERDVEFRQAQMTRAATLLEQDLASPDIRDQAKAALDAAEADLDVKVAQLEELLNGTTIEELNQARAAVDRLSAAAQRARLDLERHTSSAPLDGTVDSLVLEPGERPQPGVPMLVMLAAAQPYARIYVPEAIRVRVKPGTHATVHVDGLASSIDGRVRWVASDASFTPYFALTEHDRGRLTYVAKVDLDYSGDRLPDGVPVQVDLHVDGVIR